MTQAAATTLSPCGHSGEGEASLVQPQHDPNSRSSREPPAVSRPPGSVRQLLQGVEKPCPAPTPLSAASCSQPHAHMHSHCAHTCTPAGPAPLHPVPAQDCGGAGGAGLRTGSPGIPDSCCPPAVKPDVRHVGGQPSGPSGPASGSPPTPTPSAALGGPDLADPSAALGGPDLADPGEFGAMGRVSITGDRHPELPCGSGCPQRGPPCSTLCGFHAFKKEKYQEMQLPIKLYGGLEMSRALLEKIRNLIFQLKPSIDLPEPPKGHRRCPHSHPSHAGPTKSQPCAPSCSRSSGRAGPSLPRAGWGPPRPGSPLGLHRACSAPAARRLCLLPVPGFARHSAATPTRGQAQGPRLGDRGRWRSREGGRHLRPPPTGTPDSGLSTPAQARDPRDPPAQSHFPGPSQAAGGSRHRPTSRFPTAPLGTRRQRDLAPSSWWCCPDWKQDTKTGREADRTGGLGRTWPGEGTLARLTLTEEVAPATVTQGQWERAAEGAEPQRPYPDCMLPGLPRTLPEGSGLLPSLTHRAERSPTPPRELGMLGPAGQPLQPGAPESRCAEVRGRGLVPPGPRLPGWTKAVRPRAPVA